MKRSKSVFISVVMVLLVACATCPADTVVITGADKVDDVMLKSGDPDSQNGSTGSLTVGDSGPDPTIKRDLVRFDVSELAGLYTSIDSATLKLSMIPIVGDNNFDYGLYEVKAANAGWDETVCTYNEIDPGSGIGWMGGAGLGSPGAGYEATPFATATFDQSQPVKTVVSLPIDTALVEDWVTGAKANGGFLMRSITELVPDSRGAFYTSHRPAVDDSLTFQLDVEYTPVPEPVTMGLLGLGGLFMVIRKK